MSCYEHAVYYFFLIHIPFLLPPYPLPLSTHATQAKFIVVSGRKDGVDLVLIYRYVVIFVARFGLNKYRGKYESGYPSFIGLYYNQISQ